MEITDKLTRQISETKYLNVENTERYRPIIRLFFEKYERLEYWLYKENVFNELKDNINFKDYTLELCEQDLLRLVEWKSLTSIQDTENVNTVAEFKNRKFRYQLTEYAIEIERLVLRLESLKVKTSSLEPKLFEKIRLLLIRINEVENSHDINEIFEELNYNFTTLNENYKDFLKIFHETKTEELMKSENFILYKDKVIQYLKDFIGGFQINNLKIKQVIRDMPHDLENKIMDKIIEYQKTIPNMEPDFDYDYLREINLGKWRSIIKWFMNDGEVSESMRLKRAINDIINKILKNVSAILEMQANSMNRKNEYKHILSLFGNMNTLEDAQKLDPFVFGITEVKHIGTIEKLTDMPDESVLDLEEVVINLKSHNKKIKEKVEKRPIPNKSLEKEAQLKEIMSLKKREQEILNKHIERGFIEIRNLEKVSSFERRFILSLITNGLNKEKAKYNGEKSVEYKVSLLSDEAITLDSDDGTLEMPDFRIEFGGILE